MRGMIRFDKEEALDLLKGGKSPSEVSKIMKIPVSTVTSWNREIAPGKPKALSARERLKRTAKIINTAEAKIMTAASEIASASISDERWFCFQSVVTSELKSLAIQTAEVGQKELADKLKGDE